MDIRILDRDLKVINILDTYESFIWTDRYDECGDFELFIGMNSSLIDILQENYYLQILKSDRTMIIEDIIIKSDSESGNKLKVTGRSLESILNRRIIWGLKVLRGNLHDGIKSIITENIISPSISSRKIDNFIFEDSNDPYIKKLTIDTQYTGDNIYDIISEICKNNGIGFSITINDNQQFVFKLFRGTDRSYDQVENPYIIFSPKFDNMINSNFAYSIKEYKNVALIAGEGEAYERKYFVTGDYSGMDRREVFVDARDVTSTNDDNVQLSTDEYNKLLAQKGIDELNEHKISSTFEGEIDSAFNYKYGEDFFNGDIVQFADEYGKESKVRIFETVISESEDGLSIYPTFNNI